jgi:NRAMP (natural resistance-associated macrophage protein)-like metal ion transporter
MPDNIKRKLFTLSEFRREAGIPLVLARKLIIWGEVEAEKAIDGTLRITESEVHKTVAILKNPWQKFRYFLKALGPGLITGVADDDPSGIGTYSSVGAKFGYSILWTAAWLLPVMLAVQEVCARIGIVTNRGLAGVLQKHYRRKIVLAIVVMLIIANVINIGADLGVMAAAANLVIPVNPIVIVIFFAILIILVEILVQYHFYAKFLKWLTISVFAYIISGFLVHPNWITVASKSFIPNITLNSEYFFALIAIFGTTITPYLFFWQASEEVEENRMFKRIGHHLPHGRIHRMRTDVFTGMLLANVVFFFIIVATAQVLFSNGIREITSAAQAAEALRPFGGTLTFYLFAIGIIGTGLLAVPILAGSGAYALSEILKWKEGLDNKFYRCKGFYLIIVFSILFGLGFNFLGINPISALYFSAFLNGIIAVPLLIAIMVVGNDRKIMGEETHPKWVKFFGWAAVVAMSLALLISIVLVLIK